MNTYTAKGYVTERKTAELTGAALDYAVAMAEGHRNVTYWHATGSVTSKLPNGIQLTHSYGTDWAQAGPIIEREGINLFRQKQGLPITDPAYHPADWIAHIDGTFTRHGPTPLVAAMRSYVARAFGGLVILPVALP